MKRNIIRTLFAACIASAMILSCDPLEPETYTELFYRAATVQVKDGKATLLIDYVDEAYKISNFKTESDAAAFGVSDGDRVIALMSLKIISGMAANEVYMVELQKWDKLSLAQSKPADTLNYDYQFNNMYLSNLKYPYIWSQGHVVNVSPTYYTQSDKSRADFYLYPMQVKGDTLQMRLYSYIPDVNMSMSNPDPNIKFLCFDISTLRDSVPDAFEYSHRKEILNTLDSLDLENIVIHIFEPDTLRGTITIGDSTKQYITSPITSVITSIPFDF